MTSTNLLTEQAAASLAHKIVSSEQVRSIEPEAALLAKCSMFELMQRAGKAAFKILLQEWPKAQKVLVVAGNGNNAGHGYVLAKLAKQHGLDVSVTCQQPTRELNGDAKQAQSKWQEVAGETLAFSELDYAQFDVLVDALLGTGVTGEVSQTFQEVIQKINQTGIPVLSIDLPSGMQANTGQPLPIAVKADVTVTFVAIKPGLVTGIGKEFCGKLCYADLVVGNEFFSIAQGEVQLVNWSMLQPLQPRPKHGNKGTFGKLLCIGGNQGMAGAIRLSAESALRCGVGLVKVYCHESSNLSISAGRPEIMLANKDIDAALSWCSCIVVGPGLGQDDWSQQQFSRLLAHLKHSPKPLVIDADGLNILAVMADDVAVRDTLANLPALVFTPHPGEASRLLNCDISKIESDRYLATKNISQKYQSACVLKEAGSIIQSADLHEASVPWVCEGGNPGMATAGMGDLLTGVIGAFLAQGFTSQKAAVYGVCAHAEAGDRVAIQYGQRGMIASDLLQPLRAIVNGL
jgi:ADP-dependent NAD(P)H-hydrate dehydratase / NAD(P)H-hydrate epimerase